MATGGAPAGPYDLAIIGGGPGGYVAAIRAAQLGMRVCVVERDQLGGICANWGCIPTKALLRSAELMELLAHAGDLGIRVEQAQPDFGKMIARSRGIADKQAKGVEYLFKKNQIDRIKGTATVTRRLGQVALEVAVEGGAKRLVEARHVAVATGARPRPLPLGEGKLVEHDGKKILSYRDAMAPGEQPKRLVIIGAGAIGVEFAYFYHAVGTQVTIVEAMPHLLPVEDAEIAAVVERSFKKSGIEVLTGARVGGVDTSGTGVRVAITDSAGQARTLEGDACLLAVGVRGNSEGLGLEALGVKIERGFIQVDPKTYQTGMKGLYAFGDVIGGAMLAHKASAEGIACVEGIAGKGGHGAVDYTSIPGCTYCRPEVASVGLTEDKARAQGLDIKVGRFPFKASGKAMAASETDGLVKVIVGAKHGEILGAHVVGGAATDMVATLTLAKTAELTTDELLATVFAHPTFSEAIKEAVADAYGHAIDL
jgi:dihydrolipoamide dehydrogenase